MLKNITAKDDLIDDDLCPHYKKGCFIRALILNPLNLGVREERLPPASNPTAWSHGCSKI